MKLAIVLVLAAAAIAHSFLVKPDPIRQVRECPCSPTETGYKIVWVDFDGAEDHGNCCCVSEGWIFTKDKSGKVMDFYHKSLIKSNIHSVDFEKR